MASEFNSAGVICEGDDCEAVTDVTYFVREKKKLCKDCASKEGCIGKARKGGPSLYCEIHDEEIKLYCKTHGVPLCYSCASIDHRQKQCVHQDIEGSVMENKAKLNCLKGKAKEKLQRYRVYGDEIRQCRQDSDAHLQAVKKEVDSAVHEALKTDKDREQEDAAKINQQIDEKNRTLQDKIEKLQDEIQKINEEIQKNNDEREKRLELNHTDAEKRRYPIDNKQRDLYTNIQNIAKEVERKIGELEKSWKDDTKATENTIQILDTVLEDDKNVVKDGHRLNTSVTDELKKPLNENRVKDITCAVSGVRFVQGVGREKYNGRIDGYDGEWRLINTVNVTDKITYPIIIGCIDECNVIITDGLPSALHTYILDMNTEHIQRVITGSDSSSVTSCALLNDGKIVCGKTCRGCEGESLTGCISVYDRQWKLMNDVTIPRNSTRDFTWVDVAADQDGMIIAAERGQSKIYVINPVDGSIINTITCKENIVIRGELSSCHSIARPSPPGRRVLIIDREGAHREIPHSLVIYGVCIDQMTDDLYVVTSDDEYKTCVIDQVMSRDAMKKRREASFPLSTGVTVNVRKHYLALCRVVMTLTGNMIASDEDKILVFKKLFSL